MLNYFKKLFSKQNNTADDTIDKQLDELKSYKAELIDADEDLHTRLGNIYSVADKLGISCLFVSPATYSVSSEILEAHYEEQLRILTNYFNIFNPIIKIDDVRKMMVRPKNFIIVYRLIVNSIKSEMTELEDILVEVGNEQGDGNIFVKRSDPFNLRQKQRNDLIKLLEFWTISKNADVELEELDRTERLYDPNSYAYKEVYRGDYRSRSLFNVVNRLLVNYYLNPKYERRAYIKKKGLKLVEYISSKGLYQVNEEKMKRIDQAIERYYAINPQPETGE